MNNSNIKSNNNDIPIQKKCVITCDWNFSHRGCLQKFVFAMCTCCFEKYLDKGSVLYDSGFENHAKIVKVHDNGNLKVNVCNSMFHIQSIVLANTILN